MVTADDPMIGFLMVHAEDCILLDDTCQAANLEEFFADEDNLLLVMNFFGSSVPNKFPASVNAHKNSTTFQD